MARLLVAAAAAAAAAGLATAGGAPRDATLTIIGLSDYHSHAVPFYSEGRPGQGGMARAAAFLRRAKEEGPTLVLSGGDTMNRGTPAWSDEHRCVEWPWLDGLVDAMALGNHDLDYGPEELERCRRAARYPVLAANLMHPSGEPHLAVEGRPYLVRELAGVRVGIFAVAGPDVQRLIRPQDLPPGARWRDAVATAREVVGALRGPERAQAVVFIGHQGQEDDAAMARAVPGIDLVLGSHAHVKEELRRIPGTATWTISPYQYLAYVSRVRLSFRGGSLASVEGGLVRLDETLPEDAPLAARVAALQRRLEARRPERFAPLGQAPPGLDDTGLTRGPAPIGRWATEILRRAAGVRAFFSTASSFRAGLPPGLLRLEDLLRAVPYSNRIVTAELTGRDLADWVKLSESRAGSDVFSQHSGLAYRGDGGAIRDLRVLADPGRPERGFEPVRAEGRYRVGTTDYQAFHVAGYRELVARAHDVVRTGLDVHAVLTAAVRSGDWAAAPTVGAGLHGR